LLALLIFAVFVVATGTLVFLLIRTNSSAGDSADVQGAYTAVIAQLTFPPDRTPKPEDPAAQQSGLALDAGTGAIDAGNAWFCAWALEWQQDRGVKPLEAYHALHVLSAGYPDGPFWMSLAKPDGTALKSELDQAIDGQPGAFVNEIDAFRCDRGS
jgi:hypothetical protein